MKTLVLVDIENFAATAIPSPKSVRLAKIVIDRIAKINPEEAFYVIGCHDGLRKTIASNWPKTDSNGRINRDGFSHSGKDGADRSIVRWLHLHEDRKSEWDRIVLVSGDHFFLAPLLAYAKPSSQLVQIARSNKSRHHDYLRFKRRFKTIFLEEIIKTPIAKWTHADIDGAIDTWFDAKLKNSAKQSESDTTRNSKKNQTPKTGQNPKKRAARQLSKFPKGQLINKGRRYDPKLWTKEYDWIFENTSVYLSAKTYQSFREAQLNSEVILTLSSGEELKCSKK